MEDAMARQWSYAELGPEQLALVAEAERTLDTDVVMVYRPSDWGTVDIERVTADGLRPVELESSQLECLQGLEERVGGVMVAYKRDTH
ncbi:MAG TPA: hypothetical protein VLS46_05005 [Gaiellaceae bacterium]|nr:hypothetical protein [Gaiellaceae bacterium]